MAETETTEFAEAMVAVVELAMILGVNNICDYKGCWEFQIDEQWWIAVNGHEAKIDCSKGISVAPYHCYITYNDWPAGMINSFSGRIAAGEAANEDAFIEAVYREIKNIRKDDEDRNQ